MKKLIISTLLLAAFIFPAVSSATTTPSISALQAQIAELLKLIESLKAQILAQQGGTTAWCHTFNTNLNIGDQGTEVSALKTALQKAGFTTNTTTDYDELTASQVTAFQEKYMSEILTPSGLAHGTGKAGPATRTKLNSLYGCTAGGGTTVPPLMQGITVNGLHEVTVPPGTTLNYVWNTTKGTNWSSVRKMTGTCTNSALGMFVPWTYGNTKSGTASEVTDASQVGCTITVTYTASGDTSMTDTAVVKVVAAGTAGITPSTVCTADVKLCPDGTYVGRTGSSCSFVCGGGSTGGAVAKVPINCGSPFTATKVIDADFKGPGAANYYYTDTSGTFNSYGTSATVGYFQKEAIVIRFKPPVNNGSLRVTAKETASATGIATPRTMTISTKPCDFDTASPNAVVAGNGAAASINLRTDGVSSYDTRNLNSSVPYYYLNISNQQKVTSGTTWTCSKGRCDMYFIFDNLATVSGGGTPPPTTISCNVPNPQAIPSTCYNRNVVRVESQTAPAGEVGNWYSEKPKTMYIMPFVQPYAPQGEPYIEHNMSAVGWDPGVVFISDKPCDVTFATAHSLITWRTSVGASFDYTVASPSIFSRMKEDLGIKNNSVLEPGKTYYMHLLHVADLPDSVWRNNSAITNDMLTQAKGNSRCDDKGTCMSVFFRSIKASSLNGAYYTNAYPQYTPPAGTFSCVAPSGGGTTPGTGGTPPPTSGQLSCSVWYTGVGTNCMSGGNADELKSRCCPSGTMTSCRSTPGGVIVTGTGCGEVAAPQGKMSAPATTQTWVSFGDMLGGMSGSIYPVGGRCSKPAENIYYESTNGWTYFAVDTPGAPTNDSGFTSCLSKGAGPCTPVNKMVQECQ